MILTLYAVLMLLFWVCVCTYLLVSSAKIKYVKNIPFLQEDHPAVAIIIAVRNEEKEVEQALSSVCNLNYKNYSIIVVNDRSTDATAGILQKMAVKYTAIKIITIEELPEHWL